jgi:hypothetical protein
MSAKACLKKLYVQLNYIAPKPVGEPKYCNLVIWRRFPELITFDGGITIPCLEISTSGAGAIIAILQVPGTISWEFGFMNRQGKYVTEWHQINFSIPVMVKLGFPKIALGMLMRGAMMKGLWWASRVAAIIHKLDEIEEVLGKVAKLGANRCQAGAYEFLKSLKEYEKWLNDLMQGAASSHVDSDIAQFDRKPIGTGKFVGAYA